MEQTASAGDASTAKQAAAGRNQAALRAMASGDLAGAETALSEAVSLDATSISAWLNLAVVRRQRKDLEAAFAAIQKVLTLDPRNFPALLMSATMLETMAQGVPAALAYGRALANAPPDQALDPPTLKAVARGRVVHGAYTRQLGEHIRGQVAESESRCTAAERRRLEAFIDTTLRVRRRFRQEPTEYYYPGLPAIEFYERDEFPWLPEFESATAAIGQEVVDILREEEGGFTPYIHYAEHMPLDQWRGLNNSRRWSAYHFFDHGNPIEDRCRRAPATIAGGLTPASGGGRAAVSVRNVFGPRAAHADSPAYRRRELPAGRASAASRAAGLPVPGGRRSPGMARRSCLGLRRHHRARSLERQRRAALHTDLRRMEPTPVAGGTHRDRGDHRRDRCVQRHGSRSARLIGPDDPPCS
jgi:hypothetical protein